MEKKWMLAKGNIDTEELTSKGFLDFSTANKEGSKLIIQK